MRRVVVELKQLSADIISTTVSLFKVMIPMIILIKIVEELGGVTLLGDWLAPFMDTLGLPSSVALVWATTMLTNLYAGLLVLINTDVSLTVAQVTVLSSLLLISHSLPIEGVISKKAGVPMWVILLLRVGGGVLFAWLQHVYYTSTASNQHIAPILWKNEPPVYASYGDWAIGQVESLLTIFW